jgi:hypothetical protein
LDWRRITAARRLTRSARNGVHENLTCDNLHVVRHFVRKLLVLILAAWLPVFTGAALASVVCKDAPKVGHSHAGAQALASPGGFDAGGGAVGSADDCGGCDVCYSHCTLSLPVDGYGFSALELDMVAQAGPAPLISLSYPPADRPPLFRLG